MAPFKLTMSLRPVLENLKAKLFNSMAWLRIPLVFWLRRKVDRLICPSMIFFIRSLLMIPKIAFCSALFRWTILWEI